VASVVALVLVFGCGFYDAAFVVKLRNWGICHRKEHGQGKQKPILARHVFK
jgi:hypothetical protein